MSRGAAVAQTSSTTTDSPDLLQHGGVGLLDAEHQVAEGTVDVLAAALQRRVVGRVAQVHRDGPRALLRKDSQVKFGWVLGSGSGSGLGWGFLDW